MINIINENIEKYIIKILLTILFVLLSFPLWESLQNNSYASVAKYYDNYISLADNIKYLNNYYDKDNNKIITQLKVTNNFNKEYLLFLKVNEEIDKENINILINNKINTLENLRYDYTELYDYYLIGTIISEGNYNIEIIFLNSEIISDFKYNFELIEK